ncbi:hypothetical protein AB0C52_24795 [Streptomyces sp. NPDC048717]|uniref:hypothetical protein n=1 Tax=Streptomyces sp. NPDC048717 TaxID=3154928 RepID=UPI00341A84BE
MSELLTPEQLERLATQVGSPGRLFLRLAAYGFDNEQLTGARLIGPGRVHVPEPGTTTRALTELAALMGDRNAQTVLEAGIRAVVAHRRGALADE